MARSAVRVATVLLLALLPCFPAAEVCQTPGVPPDGLPTLQTLPITAKGQRYKACMIYLADMLEASNYTSFQDIRLNATARPISQIFDDQTMEQLSSAMSDQQVNRLCRLIRFPGLRERLMRVGNQQRSPDPAQPPSRQAPQHTPPSPAPKKKVQPGILAFATPFENDPASGIFLPHEAEYSLTADSGSYNFMMDALELVITGELYPDTSGRTRSSLEPASGLVIECQALSAALVAQGFICDEAGTIGTWVGVGAGSWQAPGSIICFVVEKAAEALKEICDNQKEYNSFIDGLIDAAEIQAAYENARVGNTNDLIIWRKIDALEKKMILMFEEMYKRLDDAVTVVSTQNCDLKTQVADVQRETNYLRYLMLTPDSRRPRFRRSTQDCSVSKPESCERPVTRKPAQPAVFDPPAACMVSDGVRQFDLNQGSEP